MFLSGFVFSHWSSGFHACLVVLLLGKCCARYAIVWLLHNLCCIGPFFYSFDLFAFLSCVFKSHVIITVRLFLYNAVITVLWNECLPFATNSLEKNVALSSSSRQLEQINLTSDLRWNILDDHDQTAKWSGQAGLSVLNIVKLSSVLEN